MLACACPLVYIMPIRSLLPILLLVAGAFHTATEQAAEHAVQVLSAAEQAYADTTNQLNALIQVQYPQLKVTDFKSGDINADGRRDVIVVAEQPCPPDDQVSSDSQCRTTLLVLNEGWPKLHIAATNQSVVGCSDCGGGGVGDPFNGIVIKGNYFSIESLYGACDKTHFVVTFHYDRARKNWFLHRFGRVDYSCRKPNGAPVREARVDVKDYGVVTFARFATGY
jgi:hypothetical protein